ncbi:hypothetical protein BA894_23495 [Vibrio natriegens]|uniref:tyrosine-type recombinase/integrase n=1 Tax=Vibrio natriegens TaxID=691 RepID=UPI000804516C|nr:tyrosine-type recombinase/integrase [Vibrio natriegens]ANQ29347.1 hypothetical protein BA894_23495 [Vibrio natriegens]
MPYSKLKNVALLANYNPIDDKVLTIRSDELPFFFHEDGLPCYEANMYMYTLLRSGAGYSQTTINSYASQIVHLIYFCDTNKIPFHRMNNDWFELFIQTVQNEKNPDCVPKRNVNSVRSIGTRCINFLFFIQDLLDIDGLIGREQSNRVTVKLRKYKFGTAYTHFSFPKESPKKRRLPVSNDDADKVWQYLLSQKNDDKVGRDCSLFNCVEELGARISEVHLLRTQDIDKATKTGNAPFLEIVTLKQYSNGPEKRILPVTHGFLNNMQEYIQGPRRNTIKKTIGLSNDHGFLFVSLTTGRPFKADSAITYYHSWKKAAGVVNTFHAHLFRHKFITEKLKEIIVLNEHINSIDDFRKRILNTERFKRQLQQWTGHRKLSSLETYIHLAFDALSEQPKVYSAMRLNSSINTINTVLDTLKLQLNEQHISTEECIEKLKNAINAFARDIGDAATIKEIKHRY